MWGCDNILMMVFDLGSIAILNIYGVDFRDILWCNKEDAIKMLKNSVLYDRGSL